MCNYERIAGRSLRQIRIRRQLTLQQAAAQFPVSVATLSRKERGFDHISRDDIRCAVRVYQLNPQERYQLWCTAGYIPEPTNELSHDQFVPHTVNQFLEQIALPVAVVDSLLFIRAWNQHFASIWPAPLDPDAPTSHFVSDFLAHTPDDEVAELWSENRAGIVRLLYQKAIPWLGRPDFQLLIQQLEENHGRVFRQGWKQAQVSCAADGTTDAEILPCRIHLWHASSRKCISYVVVNSTILSLPDCELCMLLPCTPSDEHSLAVISSLTSDG